MKLRGRTSFEFSLAGRLLNRRQTESRQCGLNQYIAMSGHLISRSLVSRSLVILIASASVVLTSQVSASGERCLKLVHTLSQSLSQWKIGTQAMLKNFWLDQNGAVISIELVLIITIAVLSLIVGLSELAVAVNTELNDVSNAVGALNQSYAFTGFHSVDCGKFKSFFSGSSYRDAVDDGDTNASCDLVCSYSSISAEQGGGSSGHHH